MQFCPRSDCNLAGDSLGTCVDKQVLGCPAFQEVDPKVHVVLQCKRVGCHGKTVALNIHDIMTGKSRQRCSADVSPCQAFLVKFQPPKQSAKQPD